MHEGCYDLPLSASGTEASLRAGGVLASPPTRL
ncbi:hypothetical protein [Deinococcus arboris]